MNNIKNLKVSELLVKLVLILSFALTFGIFFFILIYIFFKGISFLNFSLIYSKVNGGYSGILPTIINTIYVEVLTLLIAVPLGLGCAIYITQYKKKGPFNKCVDFLINILASVPSVLLGLFGYNVFCVTLGLTPSILVGSLTLTCCILPNIIKTSKEAILAVPKSYEQAAFSLGISKIRTILNLIIPSAMPGIVSSIILAAGKIMGESAALLLTVGTANKLPSNFLTHIFQSGKTLTLFLYFTAGNATTSNSVEICYAVAIILIIISFALNCFSKFLGKLFEKNQG